MNVKPLRVYQCSISAPTGAQVDAADLLVIPDWPKLIFDYPESARA